MLNRTNQKDNLADALCIIVTALTRRKERMATSSATVYVTGAKGFEHPTTSNNRKFSTKDLPSASNKACMSTPECRKHKTENIQ